MSASVEWGLFNDEGLVEGDFWSERQALAARTSRYDAEDALTVHKVCPECREGRASDCEMWTCDDPEDES